MFKELHLNSLVSYLNIQKVDSRSIRSVLSYSTTGRVDAPSHASSTPDRRFIGHNFDPSTDWSDRLRSLVVRTSDFDQIYFERFPRTWVRVPARSIFFLNFRIPGLFLGVYAVFDCLYETRIS
jgi:hypothetical protein